LKYKNILFRVAVILAAFYFWKRGYEVAIRLAVFIFLSTYIEKFFVIFTKKIALAIEKRI
jgi:hypothetical protein